MTTQGEVRIPAPNGEAITLPLPPSEYPPDVVLRALAVHAETGSIAATVAATNISKATVSKWVNSEAGINLASALRDTLRADFAHKFRLMLGKAIEETMDRLEHGDTIITKQGTARLVPVKARDAMLIASIAHDKYLALTGSINQAAKVDRLEQLAARLENKINNNHSQLAPEGDAPSPLGPEGVGGGNNNEGKNA